MKSEDLNKKIPSTYVMAQRDVIVDIMIIILGIIGLGLILYLEAIGFKIVGCVFLVFSIFVSFFRDTMYKLLRKIGA